jgi:hypothetical protein
MKYRAIKTHGDPHIANLDTRMEWSGSRHIHLTRRKDPSVPIGQENWLASEPEPL